MSDQGSQLQFERDHDNNKCLVYREDFVTKTHDGGINDRKLDRKEVWIFPNVDNVDRCLVRLVEKYLSLCPNYYRKSNFYLQSLTKPTPKQWYGEQIVGKHTIVKVVTDLMEKGGIKGFFTNHSLHRSGGTRLFRGGIDRKLIKKSTGHRSNALDEYAKTSLEQHKVMSNVISGVKVACETVAKASVEEPPVVESVNSNKCKCTCGNINDGNISEIVSRIARESGKKGKTVIKLEIEITHE